MSDQAEKLRQKMKSKRASLRDLSYVSIIEVQPGALGAIYAFNLAKSFAGMDQMPFLLDFEDKTSQEEQLSMLLNLNTVSLPDDIDNEDRFFIEDKFVQKDGVLIYLAALKSKSPGFQMLLNQIGAYVSKQNQQTFKPLFVVQSAFETAFLQELEKSSVLLLVTKGDPNDLVEAYTLIKRVHLVKANLPIGIVVTHSDTLNEAETAFQTLNSVTWRFLDRSLIWCGQLVKDRTLQKHVGKRREENALYKNSIELILKSWQASMIRGETI